MDIRQNKKFVGISLGVFGLVGLIAFAGSISARKTSQPNQQASPRSSESLLYPTGIQQEIDSAYDDNSRYIGGWNPEVSPSTNYSSPRDQEFQSPSSPAPTFNPPVIQREIYDTFDDNSDYIGGS